LCCQPPRTVTPEDGCLWSSTSANLAGSGPSKDCPAVPFDNPWSAPAPAGVLPGVCRRVMSWCAGKNTVYRHLPPDEQRCARKAAGRSESPRYHGGETAERRFSCLRRIAHKVVLDPIDPSSPVFLFQIYTLTSCLLVTYSLAYNKPCFDEFYCIAMILPVPGRRAWLAVSARGQEDY